LFLLALLPRPPIFTLFPYTTLFRSKSAGYLLYSHTPGFGTGRRETPILQSFGRCICHEVSEVLQTVSQTRICWLYSQSKALFLRSEEHTSELQSRFDLVCRLLLEKK